MADARAQGGKATEEKQYTVQHKQQQWHGQCHTHRSIIDPLDRCSTYKTYARLYVPRAFLHDRCDACARYQLYVGYSTNSTYTLSTIFWTIPFVTQDMIVHNFVYTIVSFVCLIGLNISQARSILTCSYLFM